MSMINLYIIFKEHEDEYDNIYWLILHNTYRNSNHIHKHKHNHIRK